MRICDICVQDAQALDHDLKCKPPIMIRVATKKLPDCPHEQTFWGTQKLYIQCSACGTILWLPK